MLVNNYNSDILIVEYVYIYVSIYKFPALDTNWNDIAKDFLKKIFVKSRHCFNIPLSQNSDHPMTNKISTLRNNNSQMLFSLGLFQYN